MASTTAIARTLRRLLTHGRGAGRGRGAVWQTTTKKTKKTTTMTMTKNTMTMTKRERGEHFYANAGEHRSIPCVGSTRGVSIPRRGIGRRLGTRRRIRRRRRNGGHVRGCARSCRAVQELGRQLTGSFRRWRLGGGSWGRRHERHRKNSTVSIRRRLRRRETLSIWRRLGGRLTGPGTGGGRTIQRRRFGGRLSIRRRLGGGS